MRILFGGSFLPGQLVFISPIILFNTDIKTEAKQTYKTSDKPELKFKN